MTSQSFITTKLRDFVLERPMIRVAYQNDVNTSTHIVDVQPFWVQELPWFKKFEESLVFEFIEAFPYENIHFISDQSYTKITRLDSEFVGKQYEVDSRINESVISVAQDSLISRTSVVILDTNVLIETFTEEFRTWIAAHQQEDLKIQTEFLASLSLTKFASKIPDVNGHDQGSKLKDAGESNYAMAA